MISELQVLMTLGNPVDNIEQRFVNDWVIIHE